MRVFRWLARMVVLAVVAVAVCWGVALLIESVPLFDVLVDQLILRETSVPLAILKWSIPSMIVAAIVLVIHSGLCRVFRIR